MAISNEKSQEELLVERATKDKRYFDDASAALTLRANDEFTSPAADNPRMSIEPHRSYSLAEGRRVLDDYVTASVTGKKEQAITSAAPKISVPAPSSAPQPIFGYRELSMFRPAAPKSATADLTKARRPAGPGKRGSDSE